MPTKTPTRKNTGTSSSATPAPIPRNTASIGEKLRRDFGIMTPAELAAMLEVSEHTLHSWRQRNQGPVFTYLGRRTYYRKADIHSWIDDGLVRADFVDKLQEG
jgi:hypothetical protein